MQNPIREQIRLDGRWQVRQIDTQTVSVFVPGSWTDRTVALQPGETGSVVGAEVNGAQLTQHKDQPGWQTEPHLQTGQWNQVHVDGDLDGAKLVASEELHITALEAVTASRNCLAVRIRLAGAVSAPCLLSIDFSLTTADGRRVGGMDLVVGHKARDLSVEMALPASYSGPHRLKATLCCGDRVIDNARIDIHI